MFVFLHSVSRLNTCNIYFPCIMSWVFPCVWNVLYEQSFPFTASCSETSRERQRGSSALHAFGHWKGTVVIFDAFYSEYSSVRDQSKDASYWDTKQDMYLSIMYILLDCRIMPRAQLTCLKAWSQQELIYKDSSAAKKLRPTGLLCR